MGKPNLPVDGKEYVATPADQLAWNLHVVPVGSEGLQEFGFLATVEGFGERLWFVVVEEKWEWRRSTAYETVKVRFCEALYYGHPKGSRRHKGLYPDARFVVVNQDND